MKFVMLDSGTRRFIADFWVEGDLPYCEVFNNSEKSWMWLASDRSEGAQRDVHFSLLFASDEQSLLFDEAKKMNSGWGQGLGIPCSLLGPTVLGSPVVCSGWSVRHLVQLSYAIGVVKSPSLFVVEKTDQCSHECALSGGCVQAG